MMKVLLIYLHLKMNMTFSDRNKKEQKLMHLYEKTTESKIVYEGKIFKIKSNSTPK